MALVSVSQAAAILGVSDDTVRSRVESGELLSLRDEVGCLLIDLPDDVADARAVLSSPRAQVEQRPSFVVETVHLRNLLEEREARVADLDVDVAAADEVDDELESEEATAALVEVVTVGAVAVTDPETPPAGRPGSVSARPPPPPPPD